MMETIVTLNNISKSFEDLEVLRNIELFIPENQILTIMGPSGCGKTTLLRIIASLEKPSSGEISYFKISPKNIGYIFQKLYVFPWLTVKNNVEFGLKIKGISNKNEITEILSYVGLEPFMDYYPYEISGGMLQRVAIARSLVLKPHLILMDEPFGDLDYKNKRQLYELIFSLKKKYGTTFIMVTHDVIEATHISDEIFILTELPARINERFRGIQKIDAEKKDILNKEIINILTL